MGIKLFLVATIAFLVGALFPRVEAGAVTISYNRNAAAQYADFWSENRNVAQYKSLSDDCTNFVSQAVHYGGVPFWNQQGLYIDPWKPYSNPWIKANWFELAFVQETAKATWVTPSMGAQYTSAGKGDAYLYDWGQGGGWSHLSIEAGWGQFDNYYDPTYKHNYRDYFGGYGDYIDQHTTDRYHAPWNWRYLTEQDPTVRSRMKTIIVHMNT